MGIPASISGESSSRIWSRERLGAVEHAVVVERASATEVGFGHDDSEACGFEDFDGGFSGAGLEIVVESVGPEENRRSLRG